MLSVHACFVEDGEVQGVVVLDVLAQAAGEPCETSFFFLHVGTAVWTCGAKSKILSFETLGSESYRNRDTCFQHHCHRRLSGESV
jgi:hypothetical protein